MLGVMTTLVPPPAVGWPTNGGNWYNQRYSPLTQVDRGNVANLKGVWRTHLNGSGVAPQFSGEAQPLVHDEVMEVARRVRGEFSALLEAIVERL